MMTGHEVMLFRSAILWGDPAVAALPRRALRSTLALSIVVHAGAGVVLIIVSLLTVDPIPAPPIVLRFIAAPPPAPRIATPRESPRAPLLKPPPPAPVELRASRIPPLRLPPQRPARVAPVPPPVPVEAVNLPQYSADPIARPVLARQAVRAPRTIPATIDRLQSTTSSPGGSGMAPELVFRTLASTRRVGRGDGIVGNGDGYPRGVGADPSVALRAAGGSRGPGSIGPLRGESTFAGGGVVSTLAARYGVSLVEASRLGQRTNEGARYSMLVPMLSDAYRDVRIRGDWRGPEGENLKSARVDDDAIALRYRDGTVHVVAATPDGLIALYVSAGGGDSVERSKVREAERALGALRRLIEAGGQ